MQTYRHLTGWLFVFCVVIACLGASSVSAEVIPAKTTVHDVVYRADGTPANGEALISWPGFTTADGAAVAAGSLSVSLKTGGVLDAALVPNAGGLPASTYYTVVFHLDDGKSSTEYWSVPAGTTVRIADIRSKIVPQSVAVQTVTRDYVTQSLKPLAQDTAVVHRVGNEDVMGAKNFASSPLVPTPQSDTHAANKRYVDDAISGLNPSAMGMIAAAPSADQTIAQPSGTALKVNRISATTLNGIRFADQFPNIQAAVTDAGTTGSVTIPANYPGTDRYTNPNGIPIEDLRGKPDRQKGFVNAVTDCGVPTDTTSDSCTSLQACIDNNGSKRIGLPKLAAASTGGVSHRDYTSSCQIVLHGDGTELFGMGGPSRWAGGVNIQNPSGVAGLRIDSDCRGCKASNLEFWGGDVFVPSDLKTWEDWTSESQFTATNGVDGIQLFGEAPTLENVMAYGYKRHCFWVNGAATGQPDLGKFSGMYPNACRAYGIYTSGADSNVGTYNSVNAWFNALGGVKDSAFYGNTWIAPHSTGNARDPGIAAGSSKTITSESVAANVKTITATAHGWALNQWVTTTGESDGTFAGTCKLTAVTANTAICPFTHANGSTSGGTGATSSSAQVIAYYTARGIGFGSYISTSTAGCSSWQTPYMEGNQTIPNWGCSKVDNEQGAGSKATGTHYAPTGIYAQQFLHVPHTSSGYWSFTDPTGVTGYVTIDGVGGVGNVKATGKIYQGANPSNGGGVNLSNGAANALMSRNGAGSGNVYMAYVDSANVLYLGDTAGVALQPTTVSRVKTGSSSNKDLAGQLTLAGGTASYTFSSAWTIAPICVASDTTAVAAVKVTTSTTTLTVTGTGTDVVNYICMGRT